MIAIITNKRAQANQNGSHVCAVTCPGCGYSRPVSFGGWSAIVCGGCKATLYRNSASERSDPDTITSSVRGLFADFTGGTIAKWPAYAAIFAHMDSGRITLQSIRRIASDYGISGDVINMRRGDYLAMGGGGAA